MSVVVPGEVRERRKTSEIAREYRRAGYEVFVEPTGAQIPAFLGGYRPDLGDCILDKTSLTHYP